jgi:lycopene cyclase domain-containing protein
MTYTLAAGLGVLGALVLDLVAMRTRLVRRRAFWTAYAIVLFFQLVVNGLLTGLKIVRYDSDAILGWRIAYAPVEDLLFGFAMVLMTLTIWVWLGRRAALTARREVPGHRPRSGGARSL